MSTLHLIAAPHAGPEALPASAVDVLASTPDVLAAPGSPFVTRLVETGRLSQAPPILHAALNPAACAALDAGRPVVLLGARGLPSGDAPGRDVVAHAVRRRDRLVVHGAVGPVELACAASGVDTRRHVVLGPFDPAAPVPPSLVQPGLPLVLEVAMERLGAALEALWPKLGPKGELVAVQSTALEVRVARLAPSDRHLPGWTGGVVLLVAVPEGAGPPKAEPTVGLVERARRVLARSGGGSDAKALLHWLPRVRARAVAEGRLEEGLADERLIDDLGASLGLVSALPPGAARLLDIGSGLGFPGAVVALLRPDLTVTLCDDDAARALLLRDTLASAGRADVVVEPVRSDALTGTWDLVTARHIGEPSTAVPTVLARLAPGGTAYVVRHDVDDATVAAMATAAAAAGMNVQAIPAGGGRPGMVWRLTRPKP